MTPSPSPLQIMRVNSPQNIITASDLYNYQEEEEGEVTNDIDDDLLNDLQGELMCCIDKSIVDDEEDDIMNEINGYILESEVQQFMNELKRNIDRTERERRSVVQNLEQAEDIQDYLESDNNVDYWEDSNIMKSRVSRKDIILPTAQQTIGMVQDFQDCRLLIFEKKIPKRLHPNDKPLFTPLQFYNDCIIPIQKFFQRNWPHVIFRLYLEDFDNDTYKVIYQGNSPQKEFKNFAQNRIFVWLYNQVVYYNVRKLLSDKSNAKITINVNPHEPLGVTLNDAPINETPGVWINACTSGKQVSKIIGNGFVAKGAVIISANNQTLNGTTKQLAGIIQAAKDDVGNVDTMPLTLCVSKFADLSKLNESQLANSLVTLDGIPYQKPSVVIPSKTSYRPEIEIICLDSDSETEDIKIKPDRTDVDSLFADDDSENDEIMYTRDGYGQNKQQNYVSADDNDDLFANDMEVEEDDGETINFGLTLNNDLDRCSAFKSLVSNSQNVEVCVQVDPSRPLGAKVLGVTHGSIQGLWMDGFLPEGQMYHILGSRACCIGSAIIKINGKSLQVSESSLKSAIWDSQSEGVPLELTMCFFRGTDFSQTKMQYLTRLTEYPRLRNGQRYRLRGWQATEQEGEEELQVQVQVPTNTVLATDRQNNDMPSDEAVAVTTADETTVPVRGDSSDAPLNYMDEELPTGTILSPMMKQQNYFIFAKKYKVVWEIEYKGVEIPFKTATSAMWKMHKQIVGEHQLCDDTCECVFSLSKMTQNVVSDYLTHQARNKNDWTNPRNLKDGESVVGLVDNFIPKFMPHIKTTYPDDTASQLLDRLLHMWKIHQQQQRYGLKCLEKCTCEEGWEILFGRGEIILSQQTKEKGCRQVRSNLSRKRPLSGILSTLTSAPQSPNTTIIMSQPSKRAHLSKNHSKKNQEMNGVANLSNKFNNIQSRNDLQLSKTWEMVPITNNNATVPTGRFQVAKQSLLRKGNRKKTGGRKLVRFRNETDCAYFVKGSKRSDQLITAASQTTLQPSSNYYTGNTIKEKLQEVVRKETIADLIELLSKGITSNREVATKVLRQECNFVKERLAALCRDNSQDNSDLNYLEQQKNDLRQKEIVLKIYINSIHTISKTIALKSWKRIKIRMNRIVLNTNVTSTSMENSPVYVCKLKIAIGKEHINIGELPPVPKTENVTFNKNTKCFFILNNNQFTMEERYLLIEIKEGLERDEKLSTVGECKIKVNEIYKEICEKKGRGIIERSISSDFKVFGTKPKLYFEAGLANVHVEYSKKKHLECTKSLIEQLENIKRFNIDSTSMPYKINCHIVGPKKFSLLHAAIHLDLPQIVKELIDLGADPHDKSAHGSAIMMAQRNLNRTREKRFKLEIAQNTAVNNDNDINNNNGDDDGDYNDQIPESNEQSNVSEKIKGLSKKEQSFAVILSCLKGVANDNLDEHMDEQLDVDITRDDNQNTPGTIENGTQQPSEVEEATIRESNTANTSVPQSIADNEVNENFNISQQQSVTDTILDKSTNSNTSRWGASSSSSSKTTTNNKTSGGWGTSTARTNKNGGWGCKPNNASTSSNSWSKRNSHGLAAAEAASSSTDTTAAATTNTQESTTRLENVSATAQTSTIPQSTPTAVIAIGCDDMESHKPTEKSSNSFENDRNNVATAKSNENLATTTTTTTTTNNNDNVATSTNPAKATTIRFTVPTAPVTTDPKYKLPNVTAEWVAPKWRWCRNYNELDGCQYKLNCQFDHIQAPLGEILDDDSLFSNTYNITIHDYYLKIKKEENWYTGVYDDRMDNVIYFAERGPNSFLNNHGVYWYPSREDVIQAIRRVLIVSKYRLNVGWKK